MTREELREKLGKKIDETECEGCINQEDLIKCIDSGDREGFDCTRYCARTDRTPIHWIPTDEFLDEIIELCLKEGKAE